jgi:hypothetical protein
VTFAIFCVVDGDPCPFQPTQKGTDYLLAPRRKTSSFFILPFALPLEFEFFLLLCVPLRETHPIFANPGFRQIHRAQLEKSITRLIACSPRPRPSSGRRHPMERLIKIAADLLDFCEARILGEYQEPGSATRMKTIHRRPRRTRRWEVVEPASSLTKFLCEL